MKKFEPERLHRTRQKYNLDGHTVFALNVAKSIFSVVTDPPKACRGGPLLSLSYSQNRQTHRSRLEITHWKWVRNPQLRSTALKGLFSSFPSPEDDVVGFDLLDDNFLLLAKFKTFAFFGLGFWINDTKTDEFKCRDAKLLAATVCDSQSIPNSHRHPPPQTRTELAYGPCEIPPGREIVSQRIVFTRQDRSNIIAVGFKQLILLETFYHSLPRLRSSVTGLSSFRFTLAVLTLLHLLIFHWPCWDAATR